VHPTLIHVSLGPSESSTQTASRSVQPFLHSSRQSVHIFYNGRPLPLKIAPFRGISGPPSYTSASRSIRPFLQGSLLWQTDRQTVRPTDHATRSVTIGGITCGIYAAPNWMKARLQSELGAAALLKAVWWDLRLASLLTHLFYYGRPM